jgi:hypothetical protein
VPDWKAAGEFSISLKSAGHIGPTHWYDLERDELVYVLGNRITRASLKDQHIVDAFDIEASNSVFDRYVLVPGVNKNETILLTAIDTETRPTLKAIEVTFGKKPHQKVTFVDNKADVRFWSFLKRNDYLVLSWRNSSGYALGISPRVEGKLTVLNENLHAPISCSALSFDGKTLFVGNEAGVVSAFKWGTADCVFESEVGKHRVTGLIEIESGLLLVFSRDESAVLSVVDTKTGKLVEQFRAAGSLVADGKLASVSGLKLASDLYYAISTNECVGFGSMKLRDLRRK